MPAVDATQSGQYNVDGDIPAACSFLAGKCSVLARVLETVRPPEIRLRPAGFEGLFRIIVEQQVSVASAAAIWSRCRAGLREITPQAVIRCGSGALCASGLSARKAEYVTGLAQAVKDGIFDPYSLRALDDAPAMASLQALRGIGPWSAGIYLLFCEGRRDIWPHGDAALLSAYNAARRGGMRKTMESLEKTSRRWAPYRGVAARILWAYYACMRNRPEDAAAPAGQPSL